MTPTTPTARRRDDLLAMLADLIARSGAGPLLAEPVQPGKAAFPERWLPTRGATHAVLRRLAWHANNPRAIELVDARLGAPPTDRKPETRAGLQAVEAKTLHFRLEFLGDDDVAGTLAHELGVAHAVIHRPASDPYREADAPRLDVEERDHERGSVASVYLGLGVLAANAAFQEYNRTGRFNGVYYENEHDVLRAGYLPLSDMAFLLAVQATVRGSGVPGGLRGPQNDEVTAWLTALSGKCGELRERLGIANDAEPNPRPPVIAFSDVDVTEDATAPTKTAFRWRTHRGGVGLLAGTGAGMLIAMGASLIGNPMLALVFGGALVGHVVGRTRITPRCSACATVVSKTATRCPQCRAALRGDIKSLGERLEAEERLDSANPP